MQAVVAYFKQKHDQASWI